MLNVRRSPTHVFTASEVFDEDPVLNGESSSVIDFPKPAKREIPESYSPEDTLWAIRSRLKIIAAKMGVSHLEGRVRIQLHKQIDQLFDTDELENLSTHASDESFRTLMRIILSFRPKTAPFLNISYHGDFIATWLDGENKLHIECFANDKSEWFVAHDSYGEIERFAGESPNLAGLLDHVKPFVSKGWFNPYGEY